MPSMGVGGRTPNFCTLPTRPMIIRVYVSHKRSE